MESARKVLNLVEFFHLPLDLTTAAVMKKDESSSKLPEKHISVATDRKCCFCGLNNHPRFRCSASENAYNRYFKIDRQQKVCQA